MSRFVRSSLLAALAVGVTISATTGRAANPGGTAYAYPATAYGSPSGSQLTLVSATEDQPQIASRSFGRGNGRLADVAAAARWSNRAARWLQAGRPAALPLLPQAAKSAYIAPRSPTTAAPRPAPRVLVNAPRPAAIATPRPVAPNYYSQRNGVQLRTSVGRQADRPEGVLVPAEPTSQSPSPTVTIYAPPSPEMDASVGECPTCQSCGCESCCGFCAGLEYLYLRPHFADNAAFERLTATSNPTTVTEVNQLINFDEPYNSDYHFFVGYHNSCGDEFRLGYWHLSDDGNRTGTATGDFLAGTGVAYQAPGGTELTAAGKTVNCRDRLAR